MVNRTKSAIPKALGVGLVAVLMSVGLAGCSHGEVTATRKEMSQADKDMVRQQLMTGHIPAHHSRQVLQGTQ